MFYKVGEEVFIKENFWEIKIPKEEYPGLANSMKEYAGKQITLQGRNGNNCYYADGWNWHKDWFEKVKKIKDTDISEEEILSLI